MRAFFVRGALLLLFLQITRAPAVSVSPTAKVVEMLNDMLAKSKDEMQDEKVRYAEFEQFCAGTKAVKTKSIEKADTVIGKVSGEIEALNTEIDQLDADIMKADSDIAVLGEKIGQLAKQLTDLNQNLAAEAEERKKEHADFEVADREAGEAVQTLDGAIEQLKSGEGSAQSLLQVASLKEVPKSTKQAIFSFLQSNAKKAPSGEAAAYGFQSDGLVDMFESLDETFEDKQKEARKQEMNSKHSYDMLMQELANLVQRAKEDKEDKMGQKAKRAQSLASAEGELSDTEKTKAEDKQYLEDLTAECDQKAAEFEARSEMRTGEVAALTKAIEILSGDAVSGAAEKHGMALLQQRRSKARVSSFVQLRTGRNAAAQKRLSVFLQERASLSKSGILLALAARVGNDPFAKVKKMIEDMMQKLLEEANAEAEHKGWCDTELGTNGHTRKSKTDDAEELKAEIEELTATSQKLSDDITGLSEGIATIDTAVAEQTATRENEKAKNEETIADAKAAQKAVAQAVSVLKEFYSKAAVSTAFVQTSRRTRRASPGEDAPDTWDGPFKGSTEDSSGVMGMLEVVQSDFNKLEMETTSGEAEAANSYDTFMAESSKDKAVKATDIKHKKNKKQETKSALAEAEKELEGTQEELDAANAYYAKLKKACMMPQVSPEEKTARRKEEIESLKEALAILSGEDIAA